MIFKTAKILPVPCIYDSKLMKYRNRDEEDYHFESIENNWGWKLEMCTSIIH